jgi:hypothetical protein
LLGLLTGLLPSFNSLWLLPRLLPSFYSLWLLPSFILLRLLPWLLPSFYLLGLSLKAVIIRSHIPVTSRRVYRVIVLATLEPVIILLADGRIRCSVGFCLRTFQPSFTGLIAWCIVIIPVKPAGVVRPVVDIPRWLSPVIFSP